MAFNWLLIARLFSGATCLSNNVAELSNVYIAGNYVLAHVGSDDCRPVQFCTDSRYAAFVARSAWKANSHRALVTSTSRLVSLMLLTVHLKWYWVRGHSSSELNAQADVLAKSGANGQTCMW